MGHIYTIFLQTSLELIATFPSNSVSFETTDWMVTSMTHVSQTLCVGKAGLI